MRLWINGKTLCLVLALLTSCRKDHPPEIMICIADGAGGMDCDIPGVGKVYKAPSETENYWATSQEDFAKFAAWCYDTNVEKTEKNMEKIRRRITDETYDAVIDQ